MEVLIGIFVIGFIAATIASLTVVSQRSLEAAEKRDIAAGLLEEVFTAIEAIASSDDAASQGYNRMYCPPDGSCPSGEFPVASTKGTGTPYYPRRPTPLEGWSFWKKITIDHTNVEADLENFPVLISITDTDVRDNAQADGDDILFAAQDGVTKLSHEIESYDSTTGDIVAWVEVPALSATQDTDIYMYYGNSSAGNQQDIAGTWDNGFLSVWHLDEAPDDGVANGHEDSADGNHGTAQNFQDGGGGTTAATGQINGADDFAGGESAGDYVDLGSMDVSEDIETLTISAWFNADQLSDWRLLSKASSTAVADHFWALSTNSTNLRAHLKTDGTTDLLEDAGGTLAAGTWYLGSVVYDGSTLKLFVDGDEVESAAKTGAVDRDNAVDAWIGGNPSNTDFWDGRLDEVRVATAARSEAWLKTEYVNQSDPAGFITVGVQGSEAFSAGRWELATGEETITIGDVTLTRSLTIENVCRDSTTREIVGPWIDDTSDTCSTDYAGSEDDPATQYITVTISGEGISDIVTARYITRNRNNALTQTDWSRGAGSAGPKFSFGDTYDSDNGNIVTSTFGEVTITDSVAVGELTASTVDTLTSDGASFEAIVWRGVEPGGSQVRLQIATADCSNGATNPPDCDDGSTWVYRGANCTNGTWYTGDADIPELIQCYGDHWNKTYIRYRLQLCSAANCTDVGTDKPVVRDVTILWAK